MSTIVLAPLAPQIALCYTNFIGSENVWRDFVVSTERKYTKNYPFYKEYVCPVCEGRGAVECCNADGTDCAPIPCDYCGGKGTIVEKNTAGLIGTAVVVVAVIVIAAIVLF